MVVQARVEFGKLSKSCAICKSKCKKFAVKLKTEVGWWFHELSEKIRNDTWGRSQRLLTFEPNYQELECQTKGPRST